MRIGLLSDSHDRVPAIAAPVERDRRADGDAGRVVAMVAHGRDIGDVDRVDPDVDQIAGVLRRVAVFVQPRR